MRIRRYDRHRPGVPIAGVLGDRVACGDALARQFGQRFRERGTDDDGGSVRGPGCDGDAPPDGDALVHAGPASDCDSDADGHG